MLRGQAAEAAQEQPCSPMKRIEFHPSSPYFRQDKLLTSVPAVVPSTTRQKKLLSIDDADDEESEVLCGNSLLDNNSVEDLEDRIRSALTAPGTVRNTKNPTSIKSVRFDPAIVSCGRITPGSSPTSKGNIVKPTELAHKAASLPSRRKEDSRDALVESLTRLSKLDKTTRRILLETLKGIGTEDETDTDSQRASSGGDGTDSSSTRLNPEAPAYRNYAMLKARMAQQKARANLGGETLTLPRRRPYKQTGNSSLQRGPQEPTWVNIFNPPPHMAHLQGVPAIGRPGADNSRRDFVQPPPGFPRQQPFPTGPPPGFPSEAVPRFPMPFPQLPPNPPPIHPGKAPQTIWLPMQVPPPYGLNNLPPLAYWVNPVTLQTPQPTPQLAASHPYSTLPRRPFKPKGGRGPTVDVGPEFLPSQEEQGREAQAIEPGWAKTLLNKFQEKYPQTGRIKAEIAARDRMQHAAYIQQRLEFLLYSEKEKKVRERSSEDHPPRYEAIEGMEGEHIDFSDAEKIASGTSIPSEGTVDVMSEGGTIIGEQSELLQELYEGKKCLDGITARLENASRSRKSSMSDPLP